MSLEVFERARAGISEYVGAGQNAAISLLIAFGVKSSEGAVRHAVDGPLSVAVLVADGYGKAAVVCPQQVDHLSATVATA